MNNKIKSILVAVMTAITILSTAYAEEEDPQQKKPLSPEMVLTLRIRTISLMAVKSVNKDGSLTLIGQDGVETSTIKVVDKNGNLVSEVKISAEGRLSVGDKVTLTGDFETNHRLSHGKDRLLVGVTARKAP